MKHLKNLFSSMLIVGALVLAGCGGDSTTRDDGGRSGNVIKEIAIDREIKVEGVVRGYRPGAPLSNIEVRLYQGGKALKSSTVNADGHYAFSKVMVADDRSVAAANNAANAIQLEFTELKTKKLSGDGVTLVDGDKLYANGTETPTYPDSRIEFTYVSPELLSAPFLAAADASATGLSGANLGGALTNLALTDAINEGRSYYFYDVNTVLVRDVRLVQSGVLTGTVADAKTGLPINNATVTMDTDALFTAAPVAAGDLIAVWQQTRISTTSDATGAYTFSSVPALDYSNGTPAIGEVLDIEATGYLQNSWIANATATAGAVTNDHANIQDDLVGSLGLRLLTPITYKDVTFTMKVVDENLAALSGVDVKFTFDPSSITSNGTSAYGLALANGLKQDIVWTFTSDANGVVTGTVPQINFVGAAGDANLTVLKTGYYLQGGLPTAGTPNFSSWNNDNSLIDLDVNFLETNTTLVTINERLTFDFGVIQMAPQVIKYGEQFTIQLVYNGIPLQGVTAKGFARWFDSYSGVVANLTTTLIAGDAASDANGFISFTGTIPAGPYSQAGEALVLEFDTSAAKNGNTGADYSALKLEITKFGNTLGDMDTGVVKWNTTAASLAAADNKMEFDSTRMTTGGVSILGESGSTIAVQFFGTDKYVGTLQGYLVEGTQAKTAGVVANQIVGLSVTPLGKLAKTYFSTTDSSGKYIFTSAVAPAAPVTGTAYSVKIPVAVDGAVDNAVKRLLKLKLMDTSKVFTIWVTNAGATTVTDAGLATDGTEIWLNSSTNIATRNGVDQVSTGTNTWLEQLTAVTSALNVGYAEKTLTVHTASIQDVNALDNGFHVLTLVDGLDTKPVIYNSNLNTGNATYTQRNVYTFATTNSSDSIKIIMSNSVDYTKTWIHTGAAQATTENKVTINVTGAPTDGYNAGANDGNDATVLGTEFVYDTTAVATDTTAAVGRSIVIKPAGNATKFELGVIYRMLISVYDANGNKSDDTIEFRFFDKPTYAQPTPTLAVHQMIIQNDTAANNRNIGWANSNAVAADLAAYSIAWNDKDKDDVADAREVNVLLYNVGTGVQTAAMGALQTTSIKLSRITLRFPTPTKADGTAFTAAELTTLDAASEFRVFAQAYKASDKRIIRSWTNVSTDLVGGGTINGDDTLGSSFSTQTAGYWTISCDLDSVVDTGILTFAEALASGNSVDLVVVHKDSQIDASKVLTLNGTRNGVQPAAIKNNATELSLTSINFATSADVIVTLNEAVNSTDTSVPTMTSPDARLTLVSPRYINDQEIQGQLTWVAPTTTVTLATQALSATANVIVPSTNPIVVGNDVYVNDGTLTSANNSAFAPATNVQNKLNTVTAYANNVAVNAFQSATYPLLPVVNDQTLATGTNAAGATSAVVEDNTDNSTLTAVDIDWEGIANLPQANSTTYTNTTANMPFATIWNANTSIMRYNNCNDDIKALLNTLPTGYRVYFSNGSSLELGAPAANQRVISVVNANATAATGDTTNARSTVNINAISTTTTLFNLVVYGRIDTAGALVAADATNAGTLINSATVNNAFGLRSALAVTAVPVSTTSFTYTDVSTQQRLRIGDTLYISQKQSAVSDVWNHFTVPVTAVVTNGTSNYVKLGTFTGVDGTTATSLVFTQGTAVTDMHVVFYGDQVTVGLGLTGTAAVTGLKTATAGNTASSMAAATMGISLPSALASVTDVFKDASTNSATSTYVMAAGGLPTAAALTFGGGIYDIFVK